MGERLLKSNFIMVISLVEQTGETEDKQPILKVVDTKSERTNTRKFMKDLEETGVDYKFQVVNHKPEQFQFNVFYIRLDGRMMWVYLRRDEE